MKRTIWMNLITALAVTTAACGNDAGVAVEGAWARTSPMTAEAGAVYMQLTSSEADRLIGASVDGSVAAHVEIHETVAADSGEGSGEMGGAMTMREVGEIPLPAGEPVSLEPGGLHIMLFELTEPLEVGSAFDLTLQFESADDRIVEVEIRDQAP